MTRPSGAPHRPAARGAAAATVVALLVATAGCGDKITVPVAEGIPTSATYSEAPPWQLTDPVSLIEVAGKLFVIEGAPGTLTKYLSNGVRDTAAAVVTGLRSPVALASDAGRTWVAVLEAGSPGGAGPRLSWYDRNALQLMGAVELGAWVRSAAGIAVSDSFVFVSDPDSGAVHRFRRAGNATSLAPEGLVADDAGSADSPNYVFTPRGLQLDAQGMLLICDADTVRNWVVRFDPAPPAGDPDGKGTSIGFRAPAPGCVQDLKALVLGRAPECGQPGFELGPSSALGEFNVPVGVAIDAGDDRDPLLAEFRFYVVDQRNGRIQRFDQSGNFELVIGQVAGATGSLLQPTAVATWVATVFAQTTIRFPGARVYVVDRGTRQVRVFEDSVWLRLSRTTP